MNSKNENISLKKIQTNVHSKIEDRKKLLSKQISLKILKLTWVKMNTAYSKYWKNYSIINNKSIDDCKFPILVSYQYTSDNEITMKLNTNNVKYANTVRLKVSLNEQSNNSFKVVTKAI